jgi:DNA-binding PadR family transcriptional regulator
MLDKIDKALIKGCRDNPGAQLNDIIEPLLSERSDRSLRDRLNRLEQLGYLKLDRESYRGKVLCFITESGRSELEERDGKEASTSEEVGPHE